MYGLGLYLSTPEAGPHPGTALVEQWQGHRGFGLYLPTSGYMLSPAAAAGWRGLGCGCAGVGCNCGMGQTGIFGTSLFEGGMDVTTWGPGEWAIVVMGGYVLFSALWTTKQAVSYGAGIPGRRRKTRAKKLREQAKELESKKGIFG